MPFPVSLSGLNLRSKQNNGVVAPGLGPFLSSSGDTYFFSCVTTLTTLGAFKATGYPFSSFSNVANLTGQSTEILQIGGCKVSDVIHITFMDGTNSTSLNVKYVTFDMSTDSFSSVETVDSALSTGSTQFSHPDCAVRSGGEVVYIYSGPLGGGSFSQVYYNRRTAPSTFSGRTVVSPNDSTNHFCRSKCVLGASDRVHFFFQRFNQAFMERSLSSANALDTVQENASGVSNFPNAQSYDVSGTQKIVSAEALIYFNGGASPTLNLGEAYTQGGGTAVPYLDSQKRVWIVKYASLNDSIHPNGMTIARSDDNGQTLVDFGNFISGENQSYLFLGTQTTPLDWDKVICRGHNLTTFTRGTDEVVGYFFNRATDVLLYYESDISQIPNQQITPFTRAAKQSIVRANFW